MYYKWSDHGLEIDVSFTDSDGTRMIRRVTISMDDVNTIFIHDENGFRMLFNKAVNKIRAQMKNGLGPKTISNLIGAKKVISSQLSSPRVNKQSVLPPQIEELEERLTPTPLIEGVFIKVVV